MLGASSLPAGVASIVAIESTAQKYHNVVNKVMFDAAMNPEYAHALASKYRDIPPALASKIDAQITSGVKAAMANVNANQQDEE